MDAEGITLSEVSQTGKNKYHKISLICGINKKMNKPNKNKQTHRYGKQDNGCQREEGTGDG